jgi:hypothetical protein
MVDDDIKYLFQQHANYLAWLVSIWQPKVILLPANDNMPESWGPTTQNLADIRHFEFYESTAMDDGNDEGQDYNNDDGGYNGEDLDDDEEDEESENEDLDLLEAIEELDLAGGSSEVGEDE